jgi:hypothetical protein
MSIPPVLAALTPDQVRERISQSKDIGMAYFNFARTTSSYFDVRIFFGQATVTAQGQQAFEEQLCITVSPEFAKVLRDNLTTAVDTYEKLFGKLRIPPVQPTAVEQAVPTIPKEAKKVDK